MTRAWAGGLALALVLLGGCTNAPDPPEPDPSAGATSGSEGASGSAEPRPQRKVAGLVLVAPAGWHDLVLDPPDEVAQQVAAQLGVDVEQLGQRVRADDLFLVAPGDHDVVPTLEGYVVPGTSTEEQVRADFARVGAEVLDVTTRDTEVGAVLVVRSTTETSAQRLEGATAVVPTGGKSLVLAVTGVDRHAADAALQALVGSLRDA